MRPRQRVLSAAGVAGACAAPGAGAGEAAEEQSRFEAKAPADEAHKPVKEGIEKAEAEKLKADLEEAGGSVT